MVRPTTPFVKVLVGVLVRLTTCERLTNSLPKLSLIALVGRGEEGPLYDPGYELLMLKT